MAQQVGWSLIAEEAIGRDADGVFSEPETGLDISINVKVACSVTH